MSLDEEFFPETTRKETRRMTCFKLIVAAIVISTGVVSRVIGGSSCALPMELIDDFFRHKQIRTIVLITCDNNTKTAAGFSQIKSLVATRNFWMVFPSIGKLSSLIINYYQVGIVTEHNCFNEQITQETNHNLFNSTYNWLICSKVHIKNAILSANNINIDSEVTWATNDENSPDFVLHDLYKTSPRGPVIDSYAGSWSSGRGLNYSLIDYKYERRRDMREVTLRAGVVINVLPLDNLTERLASHENRKLDSMARFNYALFSHVRDIYNFGINLHVSHSSGYQDKVTKKFDGIIGMLQHKEIDVSISSVFILDARLDAVDFAGPAWKFRSAAIFRHPSTNELHQALILPFNADVWQSCFLIWVLIIATLRLTAWVQAGRGADEVNGEDVENSWSASVIIAVSALSQQGSASTSRLLTWRLVFVTSIALATLLNNFYSASVVSSMLTPPSKTITTLRALIDSPLTVGSEDLAYSTNYFQYTTDPLAKELYAKKIAPAPPKRKSSTFYNMSEGIARIKSQDFAFNAEAISIYPLLNEALNEQEKCSLAEVTVMPLSTSFIPIQKNSPYKKLIEYGLRRLWERGLVSREERIWRAKPPYCVKQGGDFVSVDLADVATAFMVLLAGIATSIVFFAAELAVHQVEQAKRAKATLGRCRGGKIKDRVDLVQIVVGHRMRKSFVKEKRNELIFY